MDKENDGARPECATPEMGERHDEIAGQLERIADALEELVRVAKEKENLPPTPPIREKENTHTDTPRACVREGFLVPTLAEVAAFIKANGLSVDAEKFWNHYNAIGWKVGKSPIRCWQSVCHVWDRGDKRQALKEAAQLAHFDAKADERAERKSCLRASSQQCRRANGPKQLSQFINYEHPSRAEGGAE